MKKEPNLPSKRVKGRGAQVHPENRFNERHYARVHEEGLDELPPDRVPTQYFYDTPKQIVNKVRSPDVGMSWSINPYQGCEHGCAYCYARNSHEYWGYDAGLDFESRIIIKKDAPERLRQTFENAKWKPAPVSLSGNTDCYQPVEREMKLTRALLQVCLEYRNPVGIITKNQLVLRDLDVLKKLAAMDLVHVMSSITTLQEPLRRVMEPRTATSEQRLKVIRTLSESGVPVGVMNAPIIPGLNSEEIPAIIREAARHGARNAGYTIVRLNGAVKPIFKDWLYSHFPDRAEKVWHQIEMCHGGQVNDSRWGKRIKGEGQIATMINQLFHIHARKHLNNTPSFTFNTHLFCRKYGMQKSLF